MEANAEPEPKWDMPPVFHRMYVLTGWLLDRVEKFPKSARFTFGERLANTALDVVEKIVRAAYGRRRKENLEAANTELEVLRVILRLSADRHYISVPQHRFAVGEMLEIGRMIGGWLKTS
jgi:hypothetical protein